MHECRSFHSEHHRRHIRWVDKVKSDQVEGRSRLNPPIPLQMTKCIVQKLVLSVWMSCVWISVLKLFKIWAYSGGRFSKNGETNEKLQISRNFYLERSSTLRVSRAEIWLTVYRAPQVLPAFWTLSILIDQERSEWIIRASVRPRLRVGRCGKWFGDTKGVTGQRGCLCADMACRDGDSSPLEE